MAASALVQLLICYRDQPAAYSLHIMALRQVAGQLSLDRWVEIKGLSGRWRSKPCP
jgi:hypothetical protein